MFRSNSIRPIVLGLTKKDNKILVGQGYDKVKNKTFYRALGGGIEFTETSKDAIIREFKEEINADIIVHNLLGVSENIFTYKGNYGHEIVFTYSIEIPEKFYKDFTYFYFKNIFLLASHYYNFYICAFLLI